MKHETKNWRDLEKLKKMIEDKLSAAKLNETELMGKIAGREEEIERLKSVNKESEKEIVKFRELSARYKNSEEISRVTFEGEIETLKRQLDQNSDTLRRKEAEISALKIQIQEALEKVVQSSNFAESELAAKSEKIEKLEVGNKRLQHKVMNLLFDHV